MSIDLITKGIKHMHISCSKAKSSQDCPHFLGEDLSFVHKYNYYLLHSYYFKRVVHLLTGRVIHIMLTTVAYNCHIKLKLLTSNSNYSHQIQITHIKLKLLTSN